MRKFILMILLFLSTSASAQTSFWGTHTRVIGSLDVIRFLHSKFRYSPSSPISDYECEQLDFSKHIILGTLLPQKQTRLVEKPEPSFVEWYLGCVESFSYRKLNTIWKSLNNEQSYREANQSVQEYIGVELWTWMKEKQGTYAYTLNDGTQVTDYLDYTVPLGRSWAELPIGIKQSTLANLILYLVGPEFILEDLGYTGEDSVIQSRPQSKAELIDLLLSQEIKFEKLESETPSIEDAIVYYSTLLLSVGEVLTH